MVGRLTGGRLQGASMTKRWTRRRLIGAAIALVIVGAIGGMTLTGSNFTIADAYAFVIFGGVRHFGIDLAAWPKVGAYIGRIAQREAVQSAIAAEGLLEKAEAELDRMENEGGV